MFTTSKRIKSRGDCRGRTTEVTWTGGTTVVRVGVTETGVRDDTWASSETGVPVRPVESRGGRGQHSTPTFSRDGPLTSDLTRTHVLGRFVLDRSPY